VSDEADPAPARALDPGVVNRNVNEKDGWVRPALRAHGGIAATWQLRLLGVSEVDLDVEVMHGQVIRVRKGWWALASTASDIVDARRMGGRVACVSALALTGPAERPALLHIELDRHDSGRRAERDRTIVHWSRHAGTTGDPDGDANVVSAERALAQARRCRSLRPDSL
jgi:hypothetical protein